LYALGFHPRLLHRCWKWQLGTKD